MNVDDDDDDDNMCMSQSDTSSIDSMIGQHSERSESPDSQVLGDCSRASSKSAVSVIQILFSFFSLFQFLLFKFFYQIGFLFQFYLLFFVLSFVQLQQSLLHFRITKFKNCHDFSQSRQLHTIRKSARTLIMTIQLITVKQNPWLILATFLHAPDQSC